MGFTIRVACVLVFASFAILPSPKDDCNNNGIPDIEEFDCDGDGVIDACEVDSDKDSISDSVDECPCSPDVGVDASGRPLGDIDNDCDADLRDFQLFMEGFSGIGEPSPLGSWDVFFSAQGNQGYYGQFDFSTNLVTSFYQDSNNRFSNRSSAYETTTRKVTFTMGWQWNDPTSTCIGDTVLQFISNDVLRGTMTRRTESGCSGVTLAITAYRQ